MRLAILFLFLEQIFVFGGRGWVTQLSALFFSSQRHVLCWAGGHFLPQCSLPLRQGENLADFVFSRGRIGIVINIEMAFSHASRNFNSLYEGLLLRDALYKMAQAICCGGMFKLHSRMLNLFLIIS